MNLSELNGKEVININDGQRLGVTTESDFLFDPHTGILESIVIPNQSDGFLNLFQEKVELVIPWQTIVKVGPEIIVIDYDLADNE